MRATPAEIAEQLKRTGASPERIAEMMRSPRFLVDGRPLSDLPSPKEVMPHSAAAATRPPASDAAKAHTKPAPAQHAQATAGAASAGAVHVLWLPGWRPAPLNTLQGHWSKRRKLKATDRAIVQAAVFVHGIPRATGPRSVQLVLLMDKGQRCVDGDASDKSLLDALVHAGALRNDSPAWCRSLPVMYLRCLHGAAPGAFVVLTDL